jgi:hypothetical protein
MSHHTKPAAVLMALAALAAGCGATAPPAGAASSLQPSPSLATAMVTATGTWAVAVLGGSAAGHNKFWELFARPARTSSWRLVTPPGVASNGGLVIASLGARSVVAGFRPSQHLTYSPLAITHDNGTAWSPGPPAAGLADIPGALAADPSSGRLLTLLVGGAAELSSPGGTHWARLATLRSLTRSAAGRQCGLQVLSAAAFSPAGTPLLAGTCRDRSVAGIFAFTGAAWHLASPPLPASLHGRPVGVLGLTVAGNRETALLAVGTGRDTVLLAAWSPGSGRWALSPALPLGGAQVASVSVGPTGAIGAVLNGRAGVMISPGASWQWLPFLPAGTQALALGPGPLVDALAAAGTTFTDWAWTSGSAAWARKQILPVPIQYGSSG